MLSDEVRSYNLNQHEIGHALKSPNGVPICRSSFGVGRAVGRRIYFHKSYTNVILGLDAQKFVEKIAPSVPFQFNCIRYNRQAYEFAFLEYPDFNSAREPVLGRVFIATEHNQYDVPQIQRQILHHKWLYVDNNYTGFDVATSWEWSRKWLTTLTMPGDNSSMKAWNKQLEMFLLPT